MKLPENYGVFMLLLLILLMAVILNLHTPLFPIVGWDAGNSHMEAPKVFIQDHGIRFYPYINFNNFPMFSEMLSLPALMAGVPTAAQCVTFIWFLLTLAMLITHFSNRIVGILACLILMTVPAYMRQVSGATVDVVLVFYLMAGLLLMENYIQGKETSNIRWYAACVCFGIAMSIKYTAMPVMLLLVAYLMIAGARWKTMLKFICIALLIASPYYIRNVVLFGNPVFPFMHDWFAWIPGMVDATTRQMLAVDPSEMLAKFSYPGGIERMVTWIWTITMDQRWADRMILAGPVILVSTCIFAYAYIMTKRLRETSRFYLLMTVGIAGIYVIGSGILHSRYLALVYPLLAIMGAYGLNSIVKNRMRTGLSTLLIVAVIGVMLLNSVLAQTQSRHLSDLPVSAVAKEQYKRTHLMGYTAIQWLNGRNMDRGYYPKKSFEDFNQSDTTPTTSHSSRNTRLNPLNVSPLNSSHRPPMVVYGLNLEANRFHANFRLIGGIYGYGTHREIMSAHSGEDLYLHLKGFSTSYLAVNKFRTIMMIRQYPGMNPITKPGFFDYFEEVYDDPQVRIYKLKEMTE